MRRKHMSWILILVLAVFSITSTLSAAAQGTSTREERARWAEITHKLESNPLDESVNKDGEWALNRLSEVHDIHVPLCPGLLGEFNDAKYKYRHEITRQYMLASGAFLVENPGKAGDANAVSTSARHLHFLLTKEEDNGETPRRVGVNHVCGGAPRKITAG